MTFDGWWTRRDFMKQAGVFSTALLLGGCESCRDRIANRPTRRNIANLAANEQTDVSGTVYAPGSPVTVSGGGDANVGSQYVSRTLSVTGGGTLRINYDAGKAPRQRVVQLVE